MWINNEVTVFAFNASAKYSVPNGPSWLYARINVVNVYMKR
jgi:hypothetical protein